MNKSFESFYEAWAYFVELNERFPDKLIKCSAKSPWEVSVVELPKSEPAKPRHKELRKANTYVISDIEPYKSPLGTGVVGSRMARREELKRHNCREVDPSEFKPAYINERFTKKHGLQLSGEA